MLVMVLPDAIRRSGGRQNAAVRLRPPGRRNLVIGAALLLAACSGRGGVASTAGVLRDRVPVRGADPRPGRSRRLEKQIAMLTKMAAHAPTRHRPRPRGVPRCHAPGGHGTDAAGRRHGDQGGREREPAHQRRLWLLRAGTQLRVLISPRSARGGGVPYADGVPERVLVGHGVVVDAVRRRRAGVRLVRARAGRAGAAERRRQRVRAPATPRTSRCYAEHGLTHHRLSIEWARIEPEEGRRDDAAIEHYRECSRPRAAAGIAPVGLPAPLHPAGLVHRGRRGRVRRRPRPLVLLAPPRRVLRRDVRRPRVRLEADQRAGRVRRRSTRTGGRRRPPRLAPGVRRCYGATLLAQRDAWRELRGGGAPVATIHNLSPIFAVDDTVPAATSAGALEELTWTVWMRADRDGVLELPGRAPRGGRRPPRGVRPRRLLVLRRDRRRPRRARSRRTRADRARRPDGLRAVERRARHRAAPPARRAARPAAADLRARRRHRRRRVARATSCASRSRSSRTRSPTASTSAASSTGPASTTTSGPTASTCRSACSTATPGRTQRGAAASSSPPPFTPAGLNPPDAPIRRSRGSFGGCSTRCSIPTFGRPSPARARDEGLCRHDGRVATARSDAGATRRTRPGEQPWK